MSLVNAHADACSKAKGLNFNAHSKSGNFRENFIFANSVKRHICDTKKLQLGHDLPLSVNERVISPFLEVHIFTKLRICEASRK